jgi:hypothetical protein
VHIYHRKTNRYICVLVYTYINIIARYSKTRRDQTNTQRNFPSSKCVRGRVYNYHLNVVVRTKLKRGQELFFYISYQYNNMYSISSTVVKRKTVLEVTKVFLSRTVRFILSNNVPFKSHKPIGLSLMMGDRWRLFFFSDLVFAVRNYVPTAPSILYGVRAQPKRTCILLITRQSKRLML